MIRPQSPFQASLFPASFRGVPFLVEGDRGQNGRRLQTHEYPFRDTPYTEDLGRSAWRLAFSAYVLGDDCAAQRDDLIAALETKGPGILIHPTLGTVYAVSGPIEWEMKKDELRMIELRLSFVEPGQMLYPTSAEDTQAATKSAAADASTAASSDWTKNIDSGKMFT